MDTERFEYYKWIAKVIVANEEVSLADLRRQNGITYWAIDRARKIFKVRRKPGAGSAAYKKSTPAPLRWRPSRLDLKITLSSPKSVVGVLRSAFSRARNAGHISSRTALGNLARTVNSREFPFQFHPFTIQVSSA